MSSSKLLTADAIINLGLGALLLVFPTGLVSGLGIPIADTGFYPGLLGAVLFGIGIALVIGQLRPASGLGLGPAGAVSINLAGGVVLAGWLLLGSLAIPLRGQVLLWTLVAVLVGLSMLELAAGGRRQRT